MTQIWPFNYPTGHLQVCYYHIFKMLRQQGGQSFLRLRTHLSLILYTYRIKKSFSDMGRSILLSGEYPWVDPNLALLLPYRSPTSTLPSHFQNVTLAGGPSFEEPRTDLSLILYTYRNKKFFSEMSRSILMSVEFHGVPYNLTLSLPYKSPARMCVTNIFIPSA